MTLKRYPLYGPAFFSGTVFFQDDTARILRPKHIGVKNNFPKIQIFNQYV